MRLNLETPVSFQEKLVPKGAQLAGLAALVQTLGIQAPVRQPSCVAEKHIAGSQREEGGFRVFDKRYQPGDQFAEHLTFALRHENIDLLTLNVPLRRYPGQRWKRMSGPPQRVCTRGAPGSSMNY